MAKQIEGVSERILNCAKEEFLDKGYTDASLRVIAAAAETSTNSIYVRFKDKEGLFSAIVEPVLNEMIERFLKIQETFYHMDQASQRAHMAEYADGGTMELVQYMYDHLDEFRLLLDASYGTRFHNFVDELVRIEVEYEGAVQATNEMSSSMIEYINGIEVIKAFNQGKTSYARLAEKVRANAQYYFDWMRRSQLGMSMAYAFFPAQMLTVLPFGWLFYTHGTPSIGTFLTVIIDPENEAVIQKAVARLVADKTVTDIEAVCMILARAEYLVLPQRTRPKKQVEGRQELSALYGNSACCNDN